MKVKIKLLVLIMLVFPCLLLLTACDNVEGYQVNFIVDNKIFRTKEISSYDTIIVPEDPQKEGYVFEGWFWDNYKWTQPYTTNSLLNMPIEKKINIYAKFVKNCVDVNSEWVTIKFPTCINEGLVEKHCLECGKTIETKIIEPLGHQFDDWFTIKYTSVDEDGEERRNCLKCNHYETRAISKVDIIEPTCIEVENGILKWDGCSNYGFKVFVNGTPYRVDKNELKVDFKSDGFNNVEVACIKKNGELTNFIKLSNFVVTEPITNLHYTDDGTNVTFTWDSPNDLYDYVFVLNGQEEVVNKSQHTYSVDRAKVEAGAVVSVYVKGLESANFFSSKTKTIKLKQLDAPRLSIDKLSINWDEVDNANSYKVDALTTETITNTSYSYDGASAGKHTITVTAFGKDFLNNSTTYTFNKLAYPNMIEIKNQTISWEAIAGQLKYAIRYNDNKNSSEIVGNTYKIEYENIYEVELYAMPVLANTMQSDIVAIVGVDIMKSDIIVIDYTADIDYSKLSTSVILIAGEVPTGLNRTLIKGIIIPKWTTTIKSSAFSGCANAKTITIPESVTSIGDSAFANCTAIETINYNAESCSSHSRSAFSNVGKNANGVEVNIGANVEKIPEALFYNNNKIKSVVFAENSKCTSIGEYAFYSCSGLTSITIPASVTSIGCDAFYRCFSLTRVYYAGSVSN